MTKDQIAAEIKSTEDHLAALRKKMDEPAAPAVGWYVVRVTALRATASIKAALQVTDSSRYLGSAVVLSQSTYDPGVISAPKGWVVNRDWPLVYFNGKN